MIGEVPEQPTANWSDDEAEGEWSAEKDGERIGGLARGLTGDNGAA